VRVLLLTTDAYGMLGGIAQYNRDLAEALAALPQVSEVVIVARNRALPLGNIPHKIHFLSTAGNGKVRFIVEALKLATGRFDLVVCGHINLLPVATFLNIKWRAPLVLMAYGIEVWRAWRPQVARSLLARVDKVWSISEITRDRMRVWSGLPESRFFLLPNAIHLERYAVASRRQDLVEKYRLAGRKVVLTLARLCASERYKGVDEILDALPRLAVRQPALTYLIAGDGDDRARLERKALDLGVADRVLFLGAIPESDKADVIRLADVFAMPGRGEGFGFVFLEALACGVPAIGSIADGSREALRGGSLGELVDPDCSECIENAILHALDKPRIIPEGLSFFAWPAYVARVQQAVSQLRF